MINKALFLDRDGVINYDYGYVHCIENFDFISGIFDLTLEAFKKNYKIIVITNQGGIGRGFYNENDFEKLMLWMKQIFINNGTTITDIFYCPSHPTEGIGLYKKDDSRRKPKPGMIFDAMKKHDIDLAKSVLVGDNMSDINAGIAAGIGRNLLFDEVDKYKDSSDLQCNLIKSLTEAKRYLI